MNEIYDHIVGLKAIRSYADTPLTAEHLEAILEAARWTGSAKNLQLWSFIVMETDEERERLATAGNFTDPIRNAAVAIVIVQEDGGYEFDSGRVAQNVMLAAATLGVASCPITLHKDDVAGEVLGLPDGVRARYAVALGYPAPAAAPARWGGRKSLDELVSRGRYGG